APFATVWDVEVYNGQLIAGGAFPTADGRTVNNIARWDGSSWQPLGAGITGTNDPFNVPVVYALGIFDGQLIAGGIFTTAGGAPASSIARWNGSAWFPLSSGLQGEVMGFPTAVFAIQDFGEALFVGGAFTGAGGASASCVARWNGSSWSGLGA